jgi:hypothetical protein
VVGPFAIRLSSVQERYSLIARRGAAKDQPWLQKTMRRRELLAGAVALLAAGRGEAHVPGEDPKPDDSAIFDLLADWAPEAATRNRILVTNPALLYGFPESA